MCLHAVSRVPAFCSATHSVTELHEEKENKPDSDVGAPEFLELLRKLREFCQKVSKDRTNFLKVIAPWQASPWKEGRYLYYYTDVTPLTSHSSVQNKQFQMTVQSRDCFTLELTDFKTYDKGTSISQTVSGKGHNKICYFFFFFSFFPHLDNKVSTIFSGLSPISIVTVLSTFHFWLQKKSGV